MEEQKQIIEQCLSLFDNYEKIKWSELLTEVNDEDGSTMIDFKPEKKEILTNLLKQFMEIEIKGLGVTLKNEEKANSENDLIFTTIHKEELIHEGVYEYKQIKNDKEEIIKRIPVIKLNLAHIILDMTRSHMDGQKLKEEEIKQSFKNKVIKDLLHEVQHLRQDLMIKNDIISEENLLYSRENLIVAKESDEHGAMYYDFTIEKDANQVACEKCIKLMGENEAWRKEREECIDGKIAATYSMDGRDIDREDALVLQTDKLMKDKATREEGFSRFPILKREYNSDGSRKSALCLLQDMKKEIENLEKSQDIPEKKDKLIIDAKQMYYNLAYRDLKREDTSKELIEILGKKETLKHYNNIKAIFCTTKNSKIKLARSKETKEMVRELYEEKINYIENLISNIANLELDESKNKNQKRNMPEEYERGE